LLNWQGKKKKSEKKKSVRTCLYRVEEKKEKRRGMRGRECGNNPLPQPKREGGALASRLSDSRKSSPILKGGGGGEGNPRWVKQSSLQGGAYAILKKKKKKFFFFAEAHREKGKKKGPEKNLKKIERKRCHWWSQI